METNVNLTYANLVDANQLLNLSGPVMLALQKYGCTIAIIVHSVYFEIYCTEGQWYADRIVPVDGLPDSYMAGSFDELHSILYHETYVGEWEE